MTTLRELGLPPLPPEFDQSGLAQSLAGTDGGSGIDLSQWIGPAASMAMAALPALRGRAPRKRPGAPIRLAPAEEVAPIARMGDNGGPPLDEAPTKGKKKASPPVAANDPTPVYDPEKGMIEMPGANEPPIRPRSMLPGSVGTPEQLHGMSPRVADAINNPDVARGLLAFAKAKEGFGKRWYNTKQLKDAWQAELGPVEGERWFNSFMDMVGATSVQNKVVGNIRQASNYYKRVYNPLPGVAPKGENLPVPFQRTPGKGNWSAEKVEEGYGGGKGGPMHQRNLQDIFNNGGMDTVNNPKTPRFAEGLKGNFDPVAVDIVMMRVLGMLTKDPRFLAKQVPYEIKDAAGNPVLKPNGKQKMGYINPQKLYKDGKLTMEEALTKPTYWEGAPDTLKEYPHLEQYFGQLAKSIGMEPAQFQAAVWLGGGPKAGLKSSDTKSFAETFFAQVKRRAKIEKSDAPTILKRFIRGELALTVGGGALLYNQLSPDMQDGVNTLAGGGT